MPSESFPYAILNGNEDPAEFRLPVSCHRSPQAARSACDKLNSRNPNNHYYVVEWAASRTSRVRPAPEHTGSIHGAFCGS